MSPNSNMTNGGALTFVERFLKLESSGGILLVLAAVIANVMTNTDLDKWYQLLIDTPVEIRIGAFDIDKPLLLWVNDGLMAVFFLIDPKAHV